MRLNLGQIDRLNTLLRDAYSLDDLDGHVQAEFELDIRSLAGANYPERVKSFLDWIQAGDYAERLFEMLERTLTKVKHKQLLAKLRDADFIGPSLDPHDAILLGNQAFINRSDLRTCVRVFTDPKQNSPRVIRILGGSPSGKTYSYHLIRFLASAAASARDVHMRLSHKTTFGPRDLMDRIRLLLKLSNENFPPAPDDPQDARQAIDLVDWFMGELPTLAERIWLVIDDLNGPSPTSEAIEMIADLAVRIEQSKADFWLMLLGFDFEIDDPIARRMLEENTHVPDRPEVREFFDNLGKSYGQTVATSVLQRFEDEVFQGLSRPYGHDEMGTILERVELISEKIVSQGGFPS